MKICFLHHTYPGIGGTETVTNLLASYFTAHGHEVSILAWHKPADVSLKAPFTVVYLPDDSVLNSDMNNNFIYSYLEKNNINCLINQGPFWIPSRNPSEFKTVILSALHYAPTYKIENQRNAIVEIFSKKSPDVIHRIKSSIRYLFKNYFAKRDFHVQYKPELDKTIENSDGFVVLCPQYVNELQLLMQKKYYNLYSIQNGLDPKSDCNDFNKEKIVVVVSRLTKWDKRVDRILRIWEEIQDSHPDWKLQILGDGPEKANLIELAQTLGLKNCEFKGFVNIREYLPHASILAMTSSSEGFGMVILEAYKYRVIPIAYNVSDGVSDLIKNGMTGMLINPFDKNDYINKLSKLMNNESLRQDMLDEIPTTLRRYDIKNIATQWIDLIDRLSKSK